MSTPESKVKDKIKAMCKARGAYYAMPVMGGMASNGTPDFLICYKGRFIAVEAKAGKGKATALQLVRLKEIDAAGGIALIVNENGLDMVTEVFNAIDDGLGEAVVDADYQLVALKHK